MIEPKIRLTIGWFNVFEVETHWKKDAGTCCPDRNFNGPGGLETTWRYWKLSIFSFVWLRRRLNIFYYHPDYYLKINKRWVFDKNELERRNDRIITNRTFIEVNFFTKFMNNLREWDKNDWCIINTSITDHLIVLVSIPV